ncbi:MAG: hypothetical protein FJ088_13750, partial [Deltaproteobacteria bacterium]|nr:hypothetical protein [Deltaproteobacteria bacterium]
FNGALRFLAENGAEGDALISFPEGAMINYLTGLSHVSYYSSFVPPEIPSEAEEERVLRDIETGKPRFAAVLSRDVSEFGSAGFGVDYGLRIFDLLKEKYTLRNTFESGDGSFWVRIFMIRD